MTQKELKEKYMEIIKTEVWINNPKMQEFARKNIGYIVELSNGKIICLEKPQIEKDFCFGYGLYGLSDDEGMERASKLVDKAETDMKYFKDANLCEINRRIERLQEILIHSDIYEVWTKPVYYGQPDNSSLVGYRILEYSDSPDRNADEPNGKGPNGMERIYRADIECILDGLVENKTLFEKRLNTYLKRYGLSKVNAWTYLRD